EALGPDFRAAIAPAAAGQAWVLRPPRRPAVLAPAAVEPELLRLVGPHLATAVPDWRIRTPELIAYPLLPGTPGLSMDPDGTTTWHVDMASPVYAASLGTVVAQLHATDVAEAAATGIEVRSAQQARQAWRDD